jgi:hypothetical protein
LDIKRRFVEALDHTYCDFSYSAQGMSDPNDSTSTIDDGNYYFSSFAAKVWTNAASIRRNLASFSSQPLKKRERRHGTC